MKFLICLKIFEAILIIFAVIAFEKLQSNLIVEKSSPIVESHKNQLENGTISLAESLNNESSLETTTTFASSIIPTSSIKYWPILSQLLLGCMVIHLLLTFNQIIMPIMDCMNFLIVLVRLAAGYGICLWTAVLCWLVYHYFRLDVFELALIVLAFTVFILSLIEFFCPLNALFSPCSKEDDVCMDEIDI